MTSFSTTSSTLSPASIRLRTATTSTSTAKSLRKVSTRSMTTAGASSQTRPALYHHLLPVRSLRFLSSTPPQPRPDRTRTDSTNYARCSQRSVIPKVISSITVILPIVLFLLLVPERPCSFRTFEKFKENQITEPYVCRGDQGGFLKLVLEIFPLEALWNNLQSQIVRLRLPISLKAEMLHV